MERNTHCTPTLLVLKNLKRGAPNSSVRLAYFHTNRLLIELYKQETEIRCRKDDGNIKSKQASIAMVQYPILTVACLLTLLLFHYPLPLSCPISFTNIVHILNLQVTYSLCSHKYMYYSSYDYGLSKKLNFNLTLRQREVERDDMVNINFQVIHEHWTRSARSPRSKWEEETRVPRSRSSFAQV